ncbi:hypothetical protein HK105_205432 [Polyrhizophydium stewartii]|uniref:propanoyl-CoA C-acyltransferase n=1 Tax=Polyrhizophydium stewartii TaxID=2732419 RepID=A0ABR4N6C8_9FUNG
MPPTDGGGPLSEARIGKHDDPLQAEETAPLIEAARAAAADLAERASRWAASSPCVELADIAAVLNAARRRLWGGGQPPAAVAALGVRTSPSVCGRTTSGAPAAHGSKSCAVAAECKLLGNKSHGHGDAQEALRAWTWGIRHALAQPHDCEHAGAAAALFANRAMLLLDAGLVEHAYLDTERALAAGYPRSSVHKLLRRRAQCVAQLASTPRTSRSDIPGSLGWNPERAYLEALDAALRNNAVDFVKAIADDLNALAAAGSAAKTPLSNLPVQPPPIEPFVSPEIAVEMRDGERCVVALKDIPAGTTMLVESPVAWALEPTLRGRYCAYCTRHAESIGIFRDEPYCSEVCRAKHLPVHARECRYPVYERLDSVAVTALRLFFASQDDRKVPALRKAGVARQGRDEVSHLISLALLLGATVPEFADSAALSQLLMLMLQTSVNCVGVSRQETAGGEASEAIETHTEARLGKAIYATMSLVNHSCAPNAAHHFEDSALRLRTIEHVRRGDQITISYDALSAVFEQMLRLRDAAAGGGRPARQVLAALDDVERRVASIVHPHGRNAGRIYDKLAMVAAMLAEREGDATVLGRAAALVERSLESVRAVFGPRSVEYAHELEKLHSDMDYTDDALQAITKALLDANIRYDDVKFAAAGFCYGESTSGQRAIYQVGLTQIPIINVNNNCSTGSSALYMARQAVASGQVDCALAVGFEKMNPGSLGTVWQDRTNPMDKTMEIMSELRGIEAAPSAPQIFGNAGLEYIERYGGTPDSMDWIAYKSHAQSTLNPYAQFRQKYTVDQVHNARKVFGPMTLLHCSPTSDGAGAAVLASEEFVNRHGLAKQAIEICAQIMATDSTLAFDPTGRVKSSIEIAGADMTRRAANDAYRLAGISPSEIDVVELHDCFSANELITYDALGICPPGKAHEFTLSGATTLPQFAPGKTPSRRVVVNPSGGLISKGHPLGATGLAQCAELTWQLRGWAGERQVSNPRYAVQHNVGLGGAVVIGVYRRAALPASPNDAQWVDPRQRFGYNPAVECRYVSPDDVRRVMSVKGGLIGTPEKLHPDVEQKLAALKASERPAAGAASSARL